MLALLYLKIFSCSVAVLSVSVKRALQEDMNQYENAIQRIFHGRSKKRCGSQARLDDTLLTNNNLDNDGTLRRNYADCARRLPVAMAYRPKKRQFGRQMTDHPRIVYELEGKNDRRKENPRGKSVTNQQNKKSHLERNIDNIEENFPLLEARKKNLASLSDTFNISAIDLAFKAVPTKSSNMVTISTKPSTYWPPTTRTRTTPNQICRSQIDLGFLVEASRSVARTGPGNYRRLIDFVKHVILKFSLGPMMTRIGVISYGNTPFLRYGFYDVQTIPNIFQHLNLPCHNCWNAQTGLAMAFAQSVLFGCSCDPCRKKVLVVVTDGSSTDDVYIPSKYLKQIGVQIIAVGVGRYFNIHQLNSMASRPVRQNVFVGDFSKIYYLTNELVRQICNVADGSMVPSSPSPCKCP